MRVRVYKNAPVRSGDQRAGTRYKIYDRDSADQQHALAGISTSAAELGDDQYGGIVYSFFMTFMMSAQNNNDDLPEAKTPSEVKIHLGYIRRDIQNLQQETAKAIDGIGKKIDALDDHYITEAEFRPIADLAKQNAEAIKSLTEWRDTFNGKMIGFGTAIALASTLLSFALNHFIK